MWLHMSIRLMSLLFSGDLTVTDDIPLYPFPTHSPQESEFQETASDRSDDRETEDGGLSGRDKNRSFLLLFSSTPFSTSTLELLDTDLNVEKKKSWSCHLLRGKNSFGYYVCVCGGGGIL